MEISRWANTQTRHEVNCPKCNATIGEYCRQPKGRKALEPHGQRTSAYFNKIGREEFNRRHTIKSYTMDEILTKINQV